MVLLRDGRGRLKFHQCTRTQGIVLEGLRFIYMGSLHGSYCKKLSPVGQTTSVLQVEFQATFHLAILSVPSNPRCAKK